MVKVKTKKINKTFPKIKLLKPKTKKKKGTAALKISNRDVLDSPQIQVVPWASIAEWDGVCQYFRDDDFAGVMERIVVWRIRVATLPLGVEVTMYLIQALTFVAQCERIDIETELRARSLFSLALIRFLNHVSQTAVRAIGGNCTLPMYELAAFMDIPSWLVEMRHEAAQGVCLPSLSSLQDAGRFMKNWLQEKYWQMSSDTDKSSLEVFAVPENKKDELIQKAFEEGESAKRVFQSVYEHIGAYVTSRVYHSRELTVITDLDVTKFWPSRPPSIPTKEALRCLKQTIKSSLTEQPSITIIAIATRMVPQTEFYNFFSSIFPIKTKQKLRFLWQPILNLLKRAMKLGTLCEEFIKIHMVIENSTKVFQRLTALWLKAILRMMKSDQKKYAHELRFKILPIAMKSMNPYSHIYLNILLRLVKKSVGKKRVEKLKILGKIWTVPLNYETSNGLRTQNGKKLFTVEDIVPPLK